MRSRARVDQEFVSVASPAHDQLCGPNCRYRSLYEGTRLSMADLSAKYREASGRHGRLRANLITTLRRAYPASFAATEHQMGCRMQDANDEMILASLTSYAQHASLSDPRAGLGQLRQILQEAGYDLPPGDDLGTWAEAVRAARTSGPVTDAQATPVPDPAGSSPADDFGPDLINLFDETQPPEVWDPAGHDLAALFEDEPSDAPSPDGATASDAADTPPARSLLEAQRAAATSDGPAAEPPAAGQDQRNRPGEAGDGPKGSRSASPASPEPGDGPQSDPPRQLRAPWAPQPAPEPDPPADDDPAKRRGRPESTGDAKDTDTEPGPTSGAEGKGVAADTSGNSSTSASTPAPSAAAAATGPLKPQLFPAPSKPRRRKGGRPVKAIASSPGPKGVDVPQAESAGGDVEVDKTLHDKLLSQVILPHPVFTSDLAELAGSEQAVAAWEQACRDDRESPVRFIPPKARHRTRGALVIPYSYLRTAAADFTRTWWASCLKQYRGARLYELGVLLHRIGPSVLSFDLGANHLLLRCNQERGMVGLVVTFDSDLDRGSDTRDGLVAGVEELLGNPLTMLATLTTNHQALEPMVSALEDEARERSWAPPFPVIAARSWEYAGDQGHSAKLVLGG